MIKMRKCWQKRKKSYHPAKTIIRLWYHFWCRHFRSSSQLGNPLFTRVPAQSFHCCDQTPAYATEKTTASTNIHMAVQVLQSLFRFAPNNRFLASDSTWTGNGRIKYDLAQFDEGLFIVNLLIVWTGQTKKLYWVPLKSKDFLCQRIFPESGTQICPFLGLPWIYDKSSYYA